MSACPVCRTTLTKVAHHPPGKGAWCWKCKEYRRDTNKPSRWHQSERAGARVRDEEP